jgi:hypothetical protein
VVVSRLRDRAGCPFPSDPPTNGDSDSPYFWALSRRPRITSVSSWSRFEGRASANAGGVGSALSPLTIKLESPADTAIVSPDKNYAVMGKMVASVIALRDFGKNLVVRRNDIATFAPSD